MALIDPKWCIWHRFNLDYPKRAHITFMPFVARNPSTWETCAEKPNKWTPNEWMALIDLKWCNGHRFNLDYPKRAHIAFMAFVDRNPSTWETWAAKRNKWTPNEWMALIDPQWCIWHRFNLDYPKRAHIAFMAFADRNPSTWETWAAKPNKWTPSEWMALIDPK